MNAPTEAKAPCPLASREAFCSIVGNASRYRITGAWAGSAFRCHPHGLIVGGFKFTDDHHVDRTCSIQITDGSGWSNNYCRDSFANGSPHPQPVDGIAICVWRNGQWVKEEYRVTLESKVLPILEDAKRQIDEARSAEAEKAKVKHAEQLQKFSAAERAALAAFSEVQP